jgi:transcriptional regulator with XRE-family HTH domain
MTLREARFHKRVSQLDVAFAAGISQTKLSLIERGYTSPKRRERDGIAKALGVDPESIEWSATNRQAAEECNG